MSFGISISNTSGNVIIDSNFPQIPVLYSGSATGTGTSMNTGSVTVYFPASVSNPILAVRPRNLNTWLFVVVVNNDSFIFKSDSGSIIDWKVFDGNGSAWDSPSGYGACIYDQNGTLIYNTTNNQPFIKSIQTILTSTQLYGPGTNDNVFIRTLTVPFAAYDGGLPFIFSTGLVPASVLANPGSVIHGTALKWTSSTTVDFYWKIITSTGAPGPTSTSYVFNIRPRLGFFIK